MGIRFFITGGTIDGLNFHSKSKSKRIHSIIPKILKESKILVKYKIETLFFKDSRHISDQDRKIILDKCRKCLEKKIIITHGTMTMPLTARFIGKNNLNKTIVLVGSFLPAKVKNSDAKFNIGFSFACAQILPSGVYVTMNGKVFNWNNVKKNMKTKNFEEE